MNPDLPQPESLNLPKPQISEVPGGPSEAVAARPELASAPPTAMPAAPVDPQTSGLPMVPSQQNDQAGVAPSPAMQLPADDLMADDTDLIEKEWVLRAKTIVNRTKDDPHSQNKEINKVKADYIKKRYNKDIKVSED